MMWKAFSEKPIGEEETNSLSLNFGECLFCGKEGSNNQMFGGVSYHTKCLTCPECSEEHFILWRNVIPMIARCLNCLHKWELPNRGMK